MAPPVTSAKAILLVAALQGAALPLAAQGGDISRLFPASPAGYVTDVTGTLDRAAVGRLEALDRGAVRADCEARFSGRVIADHYERLYVELLARVGATAAHAIGTAG